MMWKIYSALLTIVLLVTVACGTGRVVTIYRYNYADNMFWIKKDENKGLAPADADGMFCLNEVDYNKVLEKLRQCQ